jgi:hypothetical protein
MCGSKVIRVKVIFDPSDYEIGIYFLDGECNECGALMTVPTPLDHPTNTKGNSFINYNWFWMWSYLCCL